MKIFIMACVALACMVNGDDAKKHGHSAAPAAQADTPATKTFEKFKSLADTWKGGSKDGTSCVLRYQVIADGSVVMETCEFDAHPENTMVTMYHMDGANLMLTHYCMAKNQPRMRAGEFSDDGSSVAFTFFDGTNLPSRDVGHMDKAWFKFVDADHLANKWTWYKDGKEDWMEQFTFTRSK